MRILVNERLSEHRVKTPEGYLICMDAILARTGKQTYRHNEIFKDSDDESEIEIDRPEAEVFSDKTLASFENKPITDEHPDEDVNVNNYKEHAIGFVRDIRRAKDGDQDVMIGNLVITDKDAIEEIESGERTELSCGYDCEIADDNGQYIQKNIRGNHVALCEHGRAGNARIIDSVADAKFTEGQTFVNKNGAKIKVTGRSADGKIQFEIRYHGNVDARQASEDSFEHMLKLNGYTQDSVNDAQMHTYEICYIDYGEVCIAIVAKSEQDAIRKFRRDYGYYTIVHVKQKDSIDDARYEYYVIESAGGQHLSEGGRLTTNPNDYREVEDRDEAERLARFYSQKLGVQLYVKKDFYIDSVDDAVMHGQIWFVPGDKVWMLETVSKSGKYAYKTFKSKEDAVRYAKSNNIAAEIDDEETITTKDAASYKGKRISWDRKAIYGRILSENDPLSDKTSIEVDNGRVIFVSSKLLEQAIQSGEAKLRDAIVEPDADDLKGLEKIFEQNGFKVESLKKNLFGGYHYQIRSTQTYPKEKFKETVVQIARKIDAYKTKTGCSITWNFGHMDDGTITAGVDVHDKYVKDSMKEFIVKHNDRKFKVKAASPKDAVKRVAKLK